MNFIAPYILMLPLILFFAFIAFSVCRALFGKNSRRKAAQLKKAEFEKARAKIMEDGKVDGPGKYVPHKKWDGHGTPHETTHPGSKAYNGDQWI
jgi:hypothetical protein